MLKCLDNEQEEAAIILFMFSHARRDFAAFMCSVYKYTAFTVAKMNDESFLCVCFLSTYDTFMLTYTRYLFSI